MVGGRFLLKRQCRCEQYQNSNPDLFYAIFKRSRNVLVFEGLRRPLKAQTLEEPVVARLLLLCIAYRSYALLFIQCSRMPRRLVVVNHNCFRLPEVSWQATFHLVDR